MAETTDNHYFDSATLLGAVGGVDTNSNAIEAAAVIDRAHYDVHRGVEREHG